MTFTTFLFLLTDSRIFGANMVFLCIHFEQQNYDTDFILFTLLVTNLLNYRYSIDNSTFCGNAIYSIILFLISLVYGVFYFKKVLDKDLDTEKPKKWVFNGGLNRIKVHEQLGIFKYLKLLVIILMDLFYQEYNNDPWYLFSCFVLFINNPYDDNHYKFQGRYIIPLFGFLNFNKTLTEWLVYAGFCTSMLLIEIFIIK
jgi:hypothetical protein